MANIRSLSSIVNLFNGADPVKASMAPIKPEDGEADFDNEKAFQYFPSDIQDSKGVNYASKQIPGGSHPLYQFVNGTDRTISFSAIFTSDEDPTPPDLLGALTGAFTGRFELNAGSLAQSLVSRGSDQQKNVKKHTADPAAAVLWLRSFIYPKYDASQTVIPPPAIRLYLPNSGIYGSAGGSSSIIPDSVNCIMTQCDIVYESFHRNGNQRITVVQLSFNETIQVGPNWKFTDGTNLRAVWGKADGRSNESFGSTPRPYLIAQKKIEQDKGGFLSKANSKANSALASVSGKARGFG